MTTPKSVLGVSGVCRVGFGYPTQIEAFNYAGLRVLCWVCWVWRRVRACVVFFAVKTMDGKFSYARSEKPNKPNTLNTMLLKVLILKGFSCVGFVLGCGFCVLGSVFRGEGR
ncbi:hypothetical protein [Pseudomonas sp. B28(2017)]|uniref:hypothetical protein n=1 Tax=Pseudomonas sp. B28(2017) TaxID=1981730 RepID=UPI00117A7BD3|nr:hypothetical protein [Pseudomonas sp. B28(2017)]